jgi:hypothetical protein
MRDLHTERRYRLMARPPFTVSFPSVVYEIAIAPVTGAPQWRLSAAPFDGSAEWVLCQAGEHLALLERSLYETGFSVMHPSAPSRILEELCKDGRAVRFETTKEN